MPGIVQRRALGHVPGIHLRSQSHQLVHRLQEARACSPADCTHVKDDSLQTVMLDHHSRQWKDLEV